MAGVVALATAVVIAADSGLSDLLHAQEPPKVGGLVKLKDRPADGVFRIVGRGVVNEGHVSDWRLTSLSDPTDLRIVATTDLRTAR